MCGKNPTREGRETHTQFFNRRRRPLLTHATQTQPVLAVEQHIGPSCHFSFADDSGLVEAKALGLSVVPETRLVGNRYLAGPPG